MAKIAIVYYSVYGHIKVLADEILKGVERTGAKATLLQVQETLPDSVLKAIFAPPKDKTVPICDPLELAKYDGIIFGIPTRFGMAPTQVKNLLDATGPLWAKGALIGKTAGTFFSTGSQGAGQETTALTFLTQIAHHGMIYVPMGFSHPKMSDNSEVRGGSAYGPGTIAGADGSRKPSEVEKEIARHFGEHFGRITTQLVKGKSKI